MQLKLYTSDTSPFGRKCRMAAVVAGVSEHLMTVNADYKSPEFKAINPLGKIPALELEDGRILIDSPVIAAYLAGLGDAAKVYPFQGADAGSNKGTDKWDALGLEALGDGLTDVAILIYLEGRRADGERSDAYLKAQQAKAASALDALNAQAQHFDDRTDIGVLAVAAGLGWIDQRDVIPGWRDGRDHLRAWFERFSRTQPMLATAPPENL